MTLRPLPKKKTFQIHYILALILFLTLFAAGSAGMLFSPRVDLVKYNKAIEAIQVSVIEHAGNWRDSEWQASLEQQLNVNKIDAVLEDKDGQTLVRTQRKPTTMPYRKIALIGNNQLVGTFSFFIPELDSNPWLSSSAPLAVLSGQALLFIVFSWLINRYLLKPLAAMSLAARHFAKGNLVFEMPTTRVREVAEIAFAFEIMRQGLQESLERQSNLEQERRFFISAIAHDLRTPLFSLRGYLEGLEHGIVTTPEKVAHYLSMCKVKAATIEHLIGDLFAFSRLEYLEQVPVYESLELDSVFKQAIEGLIPLADQKSITISADDLVYRCMIQADPLLLLRAIENLLDNAIRYSPFGQNIWVGCHKELDHVIFFVADDGNGIALKDLPHLFEPLYRGESSRNTITGGSGLGLAIADRIIKAHGGVLSASNRSPHGALFTARIPYCRC